MKLNECLDELIIGDGGSRALLKFVPECSWLWNSVATLPTANLIRLQLRELTHKCEQRSVGKEAAVGQCHIDHWTLPRLRTEKLGLQQCTVSSRRRQDLSIPE